MRFRAEIIKIEHPTRGDDTRAWGPPFAEYSQTLRKEGPGESAYFLSVNRNKKSLALSFATSSGQRLLHQLACKCDILVENFLPQSLSKYGLDYTSLSQLNPSLIYASITGYGQYGPASSRAGYDVMVEGEFGLMHVTGPRDGPPVKVGVAVTDLTAGLYTANAVMAALIQRGKDGKGQHIDVALSDVQVATLTNIASSALVDPKSNPRRWGTAHPSIVPYQAFKTTDGDILIGGGNDRLFGILCERLGKPELAKDEQFNVNSRRVKNRELLEKLIQEETSKKTTGEWLEVFKGSGLPYAPVNDIQATLQHPHVQARGLVEEVQHLECGPLKMVTPPVKYSSSQASIRSAPPVLGQHTDEILREILEISEYEVAQLRTKGVIS